jgi:hypothetical protein
VIDYEAAAENAMRLIGATGIAGGKPILLVGDEHDRSATMAALSVISGVIPINLNIDLAQALIDVSGIRVDPATIIAELHPHTSLFLVERIQILMLPQLRINALDVLTRVARRRPIFASWPGRLDNGRLRYADHDHPECLDEDASRALILDLSTNEGSAR